METVDNKKKMIVNLSEQNTILNTFVAEIRDFVIQKDPMRFRKNLERIAEVLAYEVSKNLSYSKVQVQTPLGVAESSQIDEQPVLATILRAGLAMHGGLLNYFDRAESAFISAYRKHVTAEEFEIFVEYAACPDIDGKVLIISDPMLATGASMVTVYKALLKYGQPKKLIICAAIASDEAISYIKKHITIDMDIYVAAIDKELTAQSYIVPGLGDAGDLAYGKKN